MGEHAKRKFMSNVQLESDIAGKKSVNLSWSRTIASNYRAFNDLGWMDGWMDGWM